MSDKLQDIDSEKNILSEENLQDEETSNKTKKKKENKEKKPLKISFIILLISYIPYLYMTYAAIAGVEFFSRCYGIEGIAVAGLVGCVFGVYPVALLYQIIYGLVNRKRFTKHQRKLIIIAASISLGSVIFVGATALVLENLKGEKDYKTGYPIVDQYLKDNFTKENYKNMRIEKCDPLDGLYRVETPLIKYGFYVQLDKERNKVENSSFFEDLAEDYTLGIEISDTLTKQYYVSDEIRIEIDSDYLRLKDGVKFDSLDNLYDICEYDIDEIVIELEEYDRWKVLDNISAFYIKQGKNLESYMEDGARFTFGIHINNEKVGYVHATKKSETLLELNISGFSDQDLMPDEEEIIEYDIITKSETFIKDPYSTNW